MVEEKRKKQKQRKIEEKIGTLADWYCSGIGRDPIIRDWMEEISNRTRTRSET